MTDHGGAASPRTKREIVLAEDGLRYGHSLNEWLRHGDHCPARRLTPDLTALEGPCNCGLNAAIEAEAAHEAPAPEGLRAFASSLRDMLAEATPGPFLWGATDDADFLAEAKRLTDEHGDAQPESWVVQTKDPDDPVIVAFSGHGPRAHRNAELIAFLLNNAGALAALATPSTPAEPPFAVHMHNAGGNDAPDVCADCGHDFRELCHERAEARPPEGLDAAVLGAAIVDHRITFWANEPCDAKCAPDIASRYARLSAGGATKPKPGATVGNRPDVATPRVAKATHGAKGTR